MTSRWIKGSICQARGVLEAFLCMRFILLPGCTFRLVGPRVIIGELAQLGKCDHASVILALGRLALMEERAPCSILAFTPVEG